MNESAMAEFAALDNNIDVLTYAIGDESERLEPFNVAADRNETATSSPSPAEHASTPKFPVKHPMGLSLGACMEGL